MQGENIVSYILGDIYVFKTIRPCNWYEWGIVSAEEPTRGKFITNL
jgi:hypothetical protein